MLSLTLSMSVDMYTATIYHSEASDINPLDATNSVAEMMDALVGADSVAKIIDSIKSDAANDDSLHSSAIINNTYEKYIERPVSMPYNNTVAVTGDSYAGILCQFEDTKDFFMTKFAIAGRTILENEEIMMQAVNSDCKIVFISIGVNDHIRYTVPYIFESTLRRILNTALINGKVVFMHTYCDYPLSTQVPSKYKLSQYDDIIRRLCYEYDNAHYIDMKGYDNEKFILSDNIHYGKEFYDIMYNKMVRILNTIDF